MPRQTNLTPQLTRKIAANVKKGCYFNVACELAGIPQETGRYWLARGKGTHPDSDTPDDPFHTFHIAIKKAEAEAEKKAAEQIITAAQGRISEKTEEGNGPKGPFSKVTREEKRDWTAAAWYLERKYPHRWGRNRMEVIQALSVLVDHGWLPSDIVETASNELASVRERMQQAFTEAAS
ncbi:MAG: hypothetical protein AAF773_00820 [Cyanobacteria bacterium P01_D01_bin.115]